MKVNELLADTCVVIPSDLTFCSRSEVKCEASGSACKESSTQVVAESGQSSCLNGSPEDYGEGRPIGEESERKIPRALKRKRKNKSLRLDASMMSNAKRRSLMATRKGSTFKALCTFLHISNIFIFLFMWSHSRA